MIRWRSRVSRRSLPAPIAAFRAPALSLHGAPGRRFAWPSLAAALLTAVLLGGCFSQRVVLESRDGVEVTLREEQEGPRPAPGPEFANVQDHQIEHSLQRIVIRYSKLTLFYRSDPVPLFSDAQLAVVKDALIRELPKLPPDRRIGVKFLDVYKKNEVDIEIYPEGGNLVYVFQSLLRRTPQFRGDKAVNQAIIHPQRGQEFLDEYVPVLKDPIGSAAKPDFRLQTEEEREEEKKSPL